MQKVCHFVPFCAIFHVIVKLDAAYLLLTYAKAPSLHLLSVNRGGDDESECAHTCSSI